MEGDWGLSQCFLVHSQLCKAFCFGVRSGRNWFLNSALEKNGSLPWNSTLPKSHEPVVADLARKKASWCSAFKRFGVGITPSPGVLLFPLGQRFLVYPLSRKQKDLVLWTQVSKVSDKSRCTFKISDIVKCWTASRFKIKIMRACRGGRGKKRLLFPFYIRLIDTWICSMQM